MLDGWVVKSLFVEIVEAKTSLKCPTRIEAVELVTRLFVVRLPKVPVEAFPLLKYSKFILAVELTDKALTFNGSGIETVAALARAASGSLILPRI